MGNLRDEKDELLQLFKNLEAAEEYLRRRRQIAEADAVKFARLVLVEEAYEISRENGNAST